MSKREKRVGKATATEHRGDAPGSAVSGRNCDFPKKQPVMLAIILGMVLSNAWSLPKGLHAGIKFSVKKLLPIGIVTAIVAVASSFATSRAWKCEPA